MLNVKAKAIEFKQVGETEAAELKAKFQKETVATEPVPIVKPYAPISVEDMAARARL